VKYAFERLLISPFVVFGRVGEEIVKHKGCGSYIKGWIYIIKAICYLPLEEEGADLFIGESDGIHKELIHGAVNTAASSSRATTFVEAIPFALVSLISKVAVPSESSRSYPAAIFQTIIFPMVTARAKTLLEFPAKSQQVFSSHRFVSDQVFISV
jgi:hypothetical protein